MLVWLEISELMVHRSFALENGHHHVRKSGETSPAPPSPHGRKLASRLAPCSICNRFRSSGSWVATPTGHIPGLTDPILLAGNRHHGGGSNGNAVCAHSQRFSKITGYPQAAGDDQIKIQIVLDNIFFCAVQGVNGGHGTGVPSTLGLAPVAPPRPSRVTKSGSA